LGEGLGKAIKGFKKSVHEADAIDVTPGEQPSQGEPLAGSAAQVSTHAEPTPSTRPATTQPSQVKQG
jgi:sec-independent protein translocase protein TatA